MAKEVPPKINERWLVRVAFDLWDGWGESVAWVAANRGDFSNGAMAAGYPTGHSYEAFDNMAYSTHVLL